MQYNWAHCVITQFTFTILGLCQQGMVFRKQKRNEKNIAQWDCFCPHLNMVLWKQLSLLSWNRHCWILAQFLWLLWVLSVSSFRHSSLFLPLKRGSLNVAGITGEVDSNELQSWVESPGPIPAHTHKHDSNKVFLTMRQVLWSDVRVFTQIIYLLCLSSGWIKGIISFGFQLSGSDISLAALHSSLKCTI